MSYKITIHKDADGENDGVRVQALDEDFLIALHDSNDGEEVTFKEAASELLPDNPMVMVLYHYLPEVNEKLKEAGGKPLNGWYWSKTHAKIVMGEDTPGRLVFYCSAPGGTFHINHNYEFFLCSAKKRLFTDLRRKEEE